MNKELLCDCVADDAGPVLADILSAFSDTTSFGDPYLNLDAANRVCAKYGRGVVALILSMLDRAGYVEHYKNLTDSSALTMRGVELRDSLAATA